MKKITLWLLLLIASNALIGAPLHYNFAVTSRQGSRPYQEDAVYPGNAGVGALPPFGVFFGIFDGHGGGQASAHVTKDTALASYLRLDKSVPEMLKAAFACVESELVGNNPAISDGSGTTATTLYLDINTCPKAYLANVGDSRTIVLRLVGGKYRVIVNTVDHKPDTPSEKARIEAAGGRVIWDGVVPRVNKFILSRTLGDAGPKLHSPRGLITAEPDIFEVDLQVGDIVIMASDGLWDVMTNEDVCALINGPQNDLFNQYYVKRDGTQDNVVEYWGSGTVDKNGVQKVISNQVAPMVARFLKNLSETAYRKGSKDNITIMGFEVVGKEGVVAAQSSNNVGSTSIDIRGTLSSWLSDMNPWMKKLLIGGGIAVAVGGVLGYWLYTKWQ